MTVSDHNSKEMKKSEGNNVRISTKSYEKLRKFIYSKGWRLGWFFEQAAIEKMQQEIEKEKK